MAPVNSPASHGSAAAPSPGQRGPADHAMRDRIVATAADRFRHYGYGKTTVADIAGDLGVSTAYLYKFFDSKLAICEAVCVDVLGRIDAALWAIARDESVPASERLRRLYLSILEQSVAMFFEERKMHDMVRTAMDNRWCAVAQHKQAMRAAAEAVLRAGRERGEFETRTPLPDLVAAVWASMIPFAHPGVLEHTLGEFDFEAHARHVAELVLRALAR